MGLSFRKPLVKVVTNANTGGPVVLSSVPLACSKVIFFANKARQTANTGDIWLGPESTDGYPCIKLTTGTNVVLEDIDLSEWYLDVGTANDGVVCLYW